MPAINNLTWGSITVDGRSYSQAIICGEEVEERDEDKLEATFGTSHCLGDWEIQKLLTDQPQAIVIGTGQEGVLRVRPEEIEALKKTGAELFLLKTPEAVEKYQELKKQAQLEVGDKIEKTGRLRHKLLTGQGVKVNALFHTTC